MSKSHPSKKRRTKAKSGSKAAKSSGPSTRIPVVDPAEGVERVLVITAHPDDVDFGAAGTVARLTSSGVEVVYCLVTDGDAGGSDLNSTAEQRAALRRAEQTAAAKEVPRSDLSAAEIAATPPLSASSVRSADWTASFA